MRDYVSRTNRNLTEATSTCSSTRAASTQREWVLVEISITPCCWNMRCNIFARDDFPFLLVRRWKTCDVIAYRMQMKKFKCIKFREFFIESRSSLRDESMRRMILRSRFASSRKKLWVRVSFASLVGHRCRVINTLIARRSFSFYLRVAPFGEKILRGYLKSRCYFRNYSSFRSPRRQLERKESKTENREPPQLYCFPFPVGQEYLCITVLTDVRNLQ